MVKDTRIKVPKSKLYGTRYYEGYEENMVGGEFFRDPDVICRLTSDLFLFDDEIRVYAVVEDESSSDNGKKFCFSYIPTTEDDWDTRYDGEYPGVFATIDYTEPPDGCMECE